MAGQPNQSALVKALLREHGHTYASEAGFRVQNGPSSLFQTLTLALLLSARIRADVAVSAMRALRERGWRTASAMADATWKQRTDVLNHAGYARYDESTSRMLGDTAQLALDRYRGDLRRLRDAAGRKPGEEKRLLTEFKGIGPTGFEVFAREAQGVWPELAPTFGDRALRAAKELGLPGDAGRLAKLCPKSDLPALAAALMRLSLAGGEGVDQVRAAAG